MPKLSHNAKENMPDKELNLMQIWDKQELPDVLCEQLVPVYRTVFEVLTDQNRPVQNVTEWSKNNICWERVKEKPVQIHPHIDDVMIDKNEAKTQVSSARTEQRMISGIEAQMFVVEKGSAYWLDILSWSNGKKLLSPEEIKILSLAGKMSGTKMPNEVQSKFSRR